MFLTFSGIFGDFSADPKKRPCWDSFGISGPEGRENPMDGHSGRKVLVGSDQQSEFWEEKSNHTLALGGPIARLSYPTHNRHSYVCLTHSLMEVVPLGGGTVSMPALKKLLWIVSMDLLVDLALFSHSRKWKSGVLSHLKCKMKSPHLVDLAEIYSIFRRIWVELWPTFRWF